MYFLNITLGKLHIYPFHCCNQRWLVGEINADRKSKQRIYAWYVMHKIRCHEHFISWLMNEKRNQNALSWLHLLRVKWYSDDAWHKSTWKTIFIYNLLISHNYYNIIIIILWTQKVNRKTRSFFEIPVVIM